jgi:hypothetical protein
MEADDVVLHRCILGELATRTEVALGTAQEDLGVLALLRTGR